MDQLQIFGEPLEYELPWSNVTRVGPVVSLGTAKALQVWTDDDGEYLAKGIHFDSGLTPWGPANELIAALLARRLRIPINDFSLINHGTDVLFGTRWMNRGNYTYCYDGNILGRCDNRESIYNILAFDVFMCNTDRHEMNLIARVLKVPRQKPSMMLTANDHDRCLMAPEVEPHLLQEWWNDRSINSFVRMPFIYQAITDVTRLDRAISEIETLADGAIRSAVQQVPDNWLAHAERRAIIDFLLRRKSRVRSIFRDGLSLFPNLTGEMP